QARGLARFWRRRLSTSTEERAEAARRSPPAVDLLPMTQSRPRDREVRLCGNSRAESRASASVAFAANAVIGDETSAIEALGPPQEGSWQTIKHGPGCIPACCAKRFVASAFSWTAMGCARFAGIGTTRSARDTSVPRLLRFPTFRPTRIACLNRCAT